MIVPLTRRLPVQGVYDDLQNALEDGRAGPLLSVSRIGDAEAPNTIAAAVYAGHRAGMELGREIDLAAVFGRREDRV